MINSDEFIENFFNKNIQFPTNLKISKKTFDEYLEDSKYIIYRGSAASIQALARNKIVIYLKFSDQINIDPLYMLKKRTYVANVNQLKKIFENKNITKNNLTNSNFTKEYFGKINYKRILNHLN